MGMHALETSHEEGENHGQNCVWMVSQRAAVSRVLPSRLCAPRALAAERQPQRQRPVCCPDVACVLVGIRKQECGGARCALSVLPAIQSPVPRGGAVGTLWPETLSHSPPYAGTPCESRVPKALRARHVLPAPSSLASMAPQGQTGREDTGVA